MDLTDIENAIEHAVNEMIALLKVEDYGNAMALAELAETLANARQGMK